MSEAIEDATKSDEFQLVRDALWKKAYVQFQKDKPDLVAAYEKLIADQNDLGDQPLLTVQNVSIVVSNQRTKMESRQRTYSWFGRTKRVRDTVESILRVVQQSAGLISTRMTMAPIYVSLPWSFVAILIPFVMNDSKELHAALDGPAFRVRSRDLPDLFRSHVAADLCGDQCSRRLAHARRKIPV